MTTAPKRAAFDASALIALLEPDDAHHARARELVARLGPGAHVTSTVSLSETLVAAVRESRVAVVTRMLDALGITEVTLPPDAALRLADLRVRTRLKLPDCCVLLAAQDADAGVLSFDDRLLDVAAGLGVGLGR